MLYCIGERFGVLHRGEVWSGISVCSIAVLVCSVTVLVWSIEVLHRREVLSGIIGL